MILKKKKNVRWGLGPLEVATSLGGRDLVWLDVRSRQGSEVATWSALVGQKQRRDMNLMSRHGRQCGRSRHGIWRRDLEIPLWAEVRSRHKN